MKTKLFTYVVLSSLAVSTAWSASACSVPRTEITVPGNAAAIQPAIDEVHANGGGTVYVSEGEFKLDGSVEVKDNVRLIGAGQGLTVIRALHPEDAVRVRGRNTRISGITLVSGGERDSIGIDVNNSEDFRIDNCEIEGCAYAAVAVDGVKSRGVIDRCRITMKIDGGLGYGVMVLRDDSWDGELKLGSIQAVFVEDCVIRYARHAVAANSGAHYVFRHNYVCGGTGHQVDAHGVGFGSRRGTQAVEVYCNLIEDPLFADTRAIGIRGGGGVIFDNIIRGYPQAVILQVEEEQAGMPYPVPDQVHDMWIWGNLHDGEGPEVMAAYSPGSRTLIREERDHFLRPKPGYTPFTYPHPLRLEADTPTPELSKIPSGLFDISSDFLK